jgi:hypothetical protein
MENSKVKPKISKVTDKSRKNLIGGSRKGVPNKTTGQLKDMILKALDHAGGSEYLLERANDPKTQPAFLQLIGKVLPMTVVGDANQPLTFTLNAPWLTKSIADRNE